MLPPRGWNSYDSFSWTIDEAAFLHNAQIMADKLLPHGYQVKIDSSGLLYIQFNTTD
jgi:hypothetical protein